MQHDRDTLLNELLKAVSRSFYLTLRVLPSAVRPQIGLAYLLARATDTIADTTLVPVAERLAALAELRERILGTRMVSLSFATIAAAQPELAGGGTNAERALLLRIEEAITVLSALAQEDRECIREVLVTITSGQQLDLERFGSAAPGTVIALPTDADLDDYTYRVAGCVGEFWTKICRRHLFPDAPMDEATLVKNGIRFGKGLQLVNILRDLPKDLRQGRCYIPKQRLGRVSLLPEDLLNPANEPRLRPVYSELLDLAEEHLAAGWAYTNALPRGSIRVRLACAWPVLIGVRTLAHLRRGNVLDAGQRIKVSRREVRRIMTATLLRYPFSGRWQRLFNEEMVESGKR